MQGRRFKRVNAKFRCTFAWAENFELYVSVDVSAGGLLLSRSAPDQLVPPLKAACECAFNLESVEIRTPCEVVRVDVSSFAVKFTAMQRGVEDRMVAWVLRQEAQSMARRLRS
jgi:c-di-GMP-binding flagellar brake protein YcgR